MKNTLKITVLVDNNALDYLKKEHGFSMLVEFEDKKILFDTGQCDSLVENAKSLKVDLSEIDFIVLSHGHYDHTGGLLDALRLSPDATVCMNRWCLVDRYSIRQGIPKSISMNQNARTMLLALPEKQLISVDKPIYMTGRVGLTGPIPRLTDFEDTGGPFFLDKSGSTPDLIEDDMAMWVKTDCGLVILVGCSHSGIINTLDYILKITNETKVHTLIGGFHLVNADEVRINKTIDALNLQFEIKNLIPCHCTGKNASKLICQKTGCKSVAGMAGLTIEV